MDKMNSHKKDEMDQNLLENDVEYIGDQDFGNSNCKSESHLVAKLSTKKGDYSSQISLLSNTTKSKLPD